MRDQREKIIIACNAKIAEAEAQKMVAETLMKALLDHQPPIQFPADFDIGSWIDDVCAGCISDLHTRNAALGADRELDQAKSIQ